MMPQIGQHVLGNNGPEMNAVEYRAHFDRTIVRHGMRRIATLTTLLGLAIFAGSVSAEERDFEREREV